MQPFARREPTFPTKEHFVSGEKLRVVRYCKVLPSGTRHARMADGAATKMRRALAHDAWKKGEGKGHAPQPDQAALGGGQTGAGRLDGHRRSLYHRDDG